MRQGLSEVPSEAWRGVGHQGRAVGALATRSPSPAPHLPVIAAQDGLQGGPELHEGRALTLQGLRRGGSGSRSRRGAVLRCGIGARAVGCPARTAWGAGSPVGAGALGQQQRQGRQHVHVLQHLLSVQQVLQQRLQPPWGWRLLGG